MNDTLDGDNNLTNNASVKYPLMKGRSGRKSKKYNSPPKDEPWFWLTAELINSLAWLYMSINCQKLIHRWIVEHSNHGGHENGRLVCTYNNFEDYGLTRNKIRPAIEEAHSLGLVKHQRGERVFAKNQPNSYRLTFYGTDELHTATNDWKRLTEERLISFKRKKTEKEERRKKFKIQQRSKK